MSQKLRHRGPDWSGIYVGDSAILAHERLSIVDPQSGGQPLYSPDRKQILAVNGEIYNTDITAAVTGDINQGQHYNSKRYTETSYNRQLVGSVL